MTVRMMPTSRGAVGRRWAVGGARIGMAIGSLLSWAAPGSARQDTTAVERPVYTIEEIRVVAPRAVTAVGGASALEVSLDSLSLGVSPTVERVLRALPAVHVRTNSRGEAELSVRGSESRQVAVLVDGVPLTLGWDARTDVSVLPAAAIGEVSLVRGLSSVLHGPNVLGGVVEMSVGRGTDFPAAPSVRWSGGFDHVGGYGTSASGSVPFETTGGRWLLRAGAGLRDSPGAPLPRGVSEPVPAGGDLRRNTDVDQVDGFVALRYRGYGDEWFSLSGSAFRAERGVAAELGVEQPRLWRYPEVSRAIVAASGGTGDRDTRLGRGDLEASVGIDVGRSELRSYASRSYEDVVGSEDGDSRTLTLRLLGDHTLGARGDLRAAFTVSDIRHDAVVDGARSEYQQRLASLGAETIWRLLDRADGPLESLRLSIGGAYDHGDTPRTGGLPSLGALDDWGVRAGLSALVGDGSTIVHASASRRGRFPALRETYSEVLDRFVPNPDLRPEHLAGIEAGVTTRVGGAELQVVGFHNRLSDAIRRVTFPDGKRMRVNADELRSAGAEVLLSYAWRDVRLGGDLMLQSIVLTERETRVSTRPENLPEASGGVHARFPFLAGSSAGARATYTGTQYCQHPDTGVDVTLDGGTWLSADVSRAWSLSSERGVFSRIEGQIVAENLADTALYDQCGLPREGRLVSFQVRLF